MDKTWSRYSIAAIESKVQDRFEYLKTHFEPLGEIAPSGRTFDVWGEQSTSDARFYACDGELAVGYLTFKPSGLPDPNMMVVAMAFVMPRYQRLGIISELYRFALQKGIVIICDNTLTKGSRAVWDGMIRDPKIAVSLIDYDRYDIAKQPLEVPLTNTRLAFSQKQRRMVARLK